MRYVVTQPFNSLTRRFAAGAEIDADEIDGHIPPERWAELGYLSPVGSEPDPVSRRRSATASVPSIDPSSDAAETPPEA